ncbi:PEP-CTERM sorting domain-containing protein [Pseudoduganella ginsengisoli]|nr:PEP-CTERM sorting domain-containing protein [Pseudoduganella ginsengisoli]
MLALMFAAAASAQAEVRTFDIVYKGLYSVDDHVFQPDKTLEVKLTVKDLDGNGSYTENEVKALKASHIDYTGTCTVVHCLEYFNWTPGSLPNYSAVYHNYDGFYNELTIVNPGVEYREFVQSNWGFRYDLTWHWTADTQTTITPTSPVPEPSGYAMLLAGLAAIGAAAWRRGGQHST